VQILYPQKGLGLQAYERVYRKSVGPIRTLESVLAKNARRSTSYCCAILFARVKGHKHIYVAILVIGLLINVDVIEGLGVLHFSRPYGYAKTFPIKIIATGGFISGARCEALEGRVPWGHGAVGPIEGQVCVAHGNYVAFASFGVQWKARGASPLLARVGERI